MSQGTLYSNISPGNSAARALINYLNLDIDVAVVDRSSADFVAKFPLMKCPSFESSKGFKLHQAIAIINYCMLLFFSFRCGVDDISFALYNYYNTNQSIDSKIFKMMRNIFTNLTVIPV